MPDISNISDDQIKMSIEMMKSNPEMFKSIMKSQGMDVSDEQLNMMSSMMNPEMLKMAQEMQKSGMVPPRNFGNQNDSTGGNNINSNLAGTGAEGMPNLDNMNSESMKNMRDEIFK